MTSYVSVLTGLLQDTRTINDNSIENVTSNCNITTSNDMIYVGGLIGLVTSGAVVISGSKVNVEFKVLGSVGGFVADFRDPTSTLSLINCNFEGNISGSKAIGTAVGSTSGFQVKIDKFK